MFTTNIRGIEKAIKQNNALITVATNKKFVYILKSYTDENLNVYTGYNFKNVLIKASKFLPENKLETQKCVMSNDEAHSSIEFALKDAGLKMFIYKKDEEYVIELYSKTDKEKERPVTVQTCKLKEGLNTAINQLEEDLTKKLFDFKSKHPKEFGIED